MKRILLITLALVMLASTVSLFACANRNDVNDDEKEVEKSNSTYNPKLNDLDFKDQEVVFVFAESENDRFTARSIKVDEDDGNEVDKQVYERNAYVEKTLGVKIESIQATQLIHGLKDAIGAQLASSSGDYDIIAGYQYYDIGMALDGYLVDMNRLGEDYGIDGYMNFDADYWSQFYNENLLVGNARYWVTGDLALRYIGGMYVTYVNSKLYQDILYEKYGDIYDIAFSGNWTMDLFAEMAEMCYLDNGSVPEEIDIDDRLGFIFEAIDPLDGLAFGAEVPFSTKYSNGEIRITINDKRTVAFIEKLDKLLHGSASYQVTNGNESRECLQQFANGNVVFTFGHIKHAENYLTEMQDGYYMLPSPKLNNDQEYYVSGVHDGCTIFGIAYDSKHIDAAAATLEVMAAESYSRVMPVYYESAVKYKYTRDDNSASIIELIRQHVETDFAAVWSSRLDNIAHFFRNCNTSKNASSNLGRRKPVYDEKLKELIASFNELNT